MTDTLLKELILLLRCCANSETWMSLHRIKAVQGKAVP